MISDEAFPAEDGKDFFLETANFRIFADRTQTEMAEHFSELLEREFEKIHKDFGFSLRPEDRQGREAEACLGGEKCADRVRCYLCADVEEYLRRTGKRREDYEPWMTGYADSREGKICLLLQEDENAARELEKIAVHELVHIIFDRQCGGMDTAAWLCEGIAILYAEQTDLQYVSDTEYPKICELGGNCVDGDTPDEFADNGGYDYAGIYVWYYIRKFGFEAFLEAYQNKLCVDGILPEDFEREAIAAYRKEARAL